ncbi:MAG TPA: UDP-glucuronic acid decarboxylase family protein [Rhabdochlamydiaceae bacterium]|jgi:UDP-glucuronate decarboxylase
MKDSIGAAMGKKRILVTGGAGFLGSHLCERLLELGHRVYCLDNLYTGALENISSLLSHSEFSFVEHDICFPYEIAVEEIYNLACPASPVSYQQDPVQTLRTSVLGAMNMLEIAKKFNARILQASTSEVYGDPHVHPQEESYWGNVNPIGMRSCYDEGKRCAETLFFDYHRQYGLSIKIARIFNTYGPRMHPQDGRVVSNFIVQAIKGEPLTIYGNGKQTRSFCYVDDLIEGLILLMQSGPQVTGPLNLGNPEEFSMQELAKIILELVESPSELLFHPLPPDDPKQRKPAINAAKALLGWNPKTTLRQGLSQTIPYFQQIVASH